MTVVITERKVACPDCNEHKFHIEHLFEKRFDNRECTWSCDKCSARFHFLVKDGVFTMTPTEQDSTRCLVLLRHRHDKKTLIVVKGYIHFSHNNNSYEEEASSKRYYYEEHTCPTNFLGVLNISREGDQDYHGIFEYVRHVAMPEAEAIIGLRNWDDKFEKGLDKVFPELADENYEPEQTEVFA